MVTNLWKIFLFSEVFWLRIIIAKNQKDQAPTGYCNAIGLNCKNGRSHWEEDERENAFIMFGIGFESEIHHKLYSHAGTVWNSATEWQNAIFLMSDCWSNKTQSLVWLYPLISNSIEFSPHAAFVRSLCVCTSLMAMVFACCAMCNVQCACTE